MKNPTFKSKNGLTMVKSKRFNWQKLSVYEGEVKEPFFYTIYVSGDEMSNGHICNYYDDEKILSICCANESSVDPSLRFKVNSIEDADEILNSFVIGMGRTLKGTIYEL